MRIKFDSDAQQTMLAALRDAAAEIQTELDTLEQASRALRNPVIP